jgi:hypothetical protein
VQLVNGKGASTAIWIFMLLLFFGGAAYDMIVLAVWPIRTLVEMAVLFVVYFCAVQYWNRKL